MTNSGSVSRCDSWRVLPRTEEANALSLELELNPILAQILVNRGINTPDGIRKFLEPDLYDLGDPFDLMGMSSAVDRLEHALEVGEKVCVYGDYDVDGLTAVTLLLKTFRSLGLTVTHYIPDRLQEGYGIHRDALNDILQEGVSLVVTVDTGMAAWQEVKEARSLGLDFIITDHHQVSGPIPDAPVVNPHQPGCAYPFKDLAGAGVAFQLVRAMLARGLLGSNGEEAILSLIDLVALGTLADQVPLLGDNRILVREGLCLIRENPRVGLKALLEVDGRKTLDEHVVCFGLAPRLNAAGRMASADLALNLLLTEDPKEAGALATSLDILNVERQATEGAILEEADHMLKQDPSLCAGVMVLAAPGWHRGVLGIVASRLSEAYHRPCLVVSLEDGVGRGSGRSIPGVDLLQELLPCSHLMDRLGGHAQAVGFELPEDRVTLLREGLSKSARRVEQQKILVDGEIDVADVNADLCRDIELLAPFGQGNPKPLFLAKAWASSVRNVGKGGAHVQMDLFSHRGSEPVSAVAFGFGSVSHKMKPQPMEYLFTLREEEWRGRRRSRAIIEDFRPLESWALPLLDDPGYEAFFSPQVLRAWEDSAPMGFPWRRTQRAATKKGLPRDKRWRGGMKEVTEAVAREQGYGSSLIVLRDPGEVVSWSRHLIYIDDTLGVGSAHGLGYPPDPEGFDVMVVSEQFFREMPGDWARKWSSPALAVFPDGIRVSFPGPVWVLERCGLEVPLVDARNDRERRSHLLEVIKGTSRCFVYVNTPYRAARLVHALRKRLPEMKPSIMYYHPGLGEHACSSLARRFDEGGIRVLVGTGSEGIRCHDTDVVFWHMPLDSWLFRSIAELAASSARVHLLYGKTDVDSAQRLINGLLPDRDVLVNLYTSLRSQDRLFEYRSPAELAKTLVPDKPVKAVTQGLEILVEMELISREGTGPWTLRVPKVEGKRDLDTNLRFREAALLQAKFDAWKDAAVTWPAHRLSEVL